MVTVELAVGVIINGGHVEQVFVTVAEVTGADFTPMNLTSGQVGQSLTMIPVSVELGGVVVATVLDSVIIESDPVIVTGGQVEQGW